MKAVLLNSGGIDSRITAALLNKEGWQLHSLFIACERNVVNAQIPPAQKTADLYCVSHKELKVPEVWAVDKAENIQNIPFKGPYVLIVGAQYANFLKINEVATGMRCDISEGDVVKYLQTALDFLTPRNRPVKFLYPLWQHFELKNVIEIAKELNVPLEDTYSCTFYPPCGKCPACRRRKEVGL